MSTENRDIAGLDHWRQTERNTDVAMQAFSPLPGVRGYARRTWHQLFEQTLVPTAAGGRRAELLELGCGGSAYLPYFARSFGFDVSGIDYAQQGIDLAQRMCQAHSVTPHLFCSDLFDPPQACVGRYDAVVSFGVAEHFTDTAATITAFAKFLRHDGVMLTVVPNMKGLTGLGQRALAPEVYRVHEVIDPARLREAHERAGLVVERCEYFLFSNFGVINPGTQPGSAKRLAFAALRGATGLAWAFESMIGALPSNTVTSPYVICAARKKARAM